MRILEEFWYGNIEPTEYDTSSKEYKKLQELICRNEEKLKATMTDEHVNFAHAATPARTFSHGVTGFQPHRHGAEPQWSEGLSGPSELFFRCCSSGQ